MKAPRRVIWLSVATTCALAGCKQSSTPEAASPPAAEPTPAAAVDDATAFPASEPDSSPRLPGAQRSPVVHPLHDPQPIDVLKTKPLYQFNEREVDVYLRYLALRETDPHQRIVQLARKNIGQPYELYLLGEFPYETYDPDPMYCLAKSDCVTFAEHTYAMALGHDWGSFFEILQRLRYKDGRVGMLTRNHETLCDWDRNNSWLFTDITKSLGPGRPWVAMEVSWRPSKFFSQFGIGQNLPDVKITDAYIPRDKIPKILPQLKDGDFVNIIRGNRGGEWCGHVGLIAHGPRGDVHLIHSTEPAVREEPLTDYLNRSTSTRGMKFLRLRPDAQRAVDGELVAGRAAYATGGDPPIREQPHSR